MATNLFADSPTLIGAPNLFTGFGAQQQPPEDRGLIATILEETGRDIAGAGRTLVAPIGSVLEAVGLESPITIEDLETRDLVGAAMVASLFVGAGAGVAARGIAAGQGLRTLTSAAARREAAQFASQLGFVRRAVIAAGGEATAGAFFGAVRPLEAAEGRFGAILGETVLFGGLGGGFSMVGSAVKATIGTRIAALKGTTRAALLAQTARQEQTRTFLREFAGIRLRNPETGSISEVTRLASGPIRLRRYSEDLTETAAEDFSNFNEALSAAFGTGNVENLGVARSRLNLTNLENLDRSILEQVEGAQGNIVSALNQVDLAGYNATRDIIQKSTEQQRLLNWLSVEDATESITPLGNVELSQAFKRSVLEVLPRSEAARIAPLNDADFLRESMQRGVVSIENLVDAAQARDFVKEIVVNQAIPANNFVLAATPAYDVTFLSKIVTPQTLAKIHPEIQPLYDLADGAAVQQELGTRTALEFMDNLQNTISGSKAAAAVRIIDESQTAGTVAEARQAARTAAVETGDQQIIDFVGQVTDRLEGYRLRAIAAGRLGNVSEELRDAAPQARQLIGQAIDDPVALQQLAATNPAARELLDDAGRVGYFPILNLGGFRLEVNGAWQGFHDTFNQALRAASEANGRAVITPRSTNVDAGTMRVVSGKDFGRMTQAIREAEGFEISSREAAEALKETGVVPSAGPRKYSRFLQQRKLGVRDFSEDPFTSLRFYMMNMERTLAFNEFERQSQAIIANIPSSKNQLAEWAEQYTSLVLGRPTKAESLIQNFVEGLVPGQVKPRVAKRWSLAARRAQGNLKLGGVWSGVVNSTQIAVNTVPVLGTRWTAEGLRKMLSGKKQRQAALKFFAENDFDLGVHVPLTRAGELAGAESVSKEIKAAFARAQLGESKAALRKAGEALENMWMFTFNGAERMNRFVTAWGAYQKGLRELGKTQEGALAYAKEIVEQTQFNYRISNIPTLFQGPIGGLLGQFKTFFINEAELIASLPNRTRLKMLVAMQAVGGLSGVLALPGLDLIDAASKLMFDTKLSEGLRVGAFQATERGEGAGGLINFTAFGAPGLLGPFSVDLSNYVGPGGFAEMMRGWAGPTLSDANNLRTFLGGSLRDIRSVGRVTPDTYNAFFQRVMPSQIRRITRGLDVLETGEVRNPYSGKLIYRPADRLRVAAFEAIGAPDLRLSVERTIDDVVNRKVAAYRDARASYRKQIGLALSRRDQAEASRLQREAATGGIVFDAAEMRSALESFQRPAAERRERRTPVDIRDDLLEFYGVR